MVVIHKRMISFLEITNWCERNNLQSVYLPSFYFAFDYTVFNVFQMLFSFFVNLFNFCGF